MQVFMKATRGKMLDRCGVYKGTDRCCREIDHSGPHDYSKLPGFDHSTKPKCRELTVEETREAYREFRKEFTADFASEEIAKSYLLFAATVSRFLLRKFAEVNGLDYTDE